MRAQGLAQEKFDLTTTVTSGDFPNLDTALLIVGTEGQTFEFDADLKLTSSGITGEEGAQGWSIGLRNEVLDVLATTTDGTVSADVSKGGLVNGGFVVNELIDPAKNAGKQGSVQAVVLSFTQPISLPVNQTHVIAKNRYKATIPAAETTGVLRFEDGLKGKGQPVQNNITFKGQTKIPTLGEKKITIRKSVVAEPEKGKCGDKIDNDLDGKTDCADEDCADDFAACPQPENTDAACDDDKDNDNDGKTDCDDTDCKTTKPCSAPSTKGFDLILSGDGNNERQGNKNVFGIDCEADDEQPSFVVIVSIEKTHDPEPNGAQGWSIGATHDSTKLDIKDGDGFPSIDGTDAAANFSGGFNKTQVIDPAKNNGKAGFVSAIVLSFTENKTLDPTKNQTICKSKYTKKLGVEENAFPTTIMFMDGLRGAGQPVQNILTVNGASVTPTNFIALDIECVAGPKAGEFIRGNANDDGKVNIADPIWIINELVRHGPKTTCQDAADANDDGLVDLSDAMYLIQWRFLAGPEPKSPFPACGADSTPDTLDCEAGSAKSCP